MSSLYDAIIVGAGPAGGTAAFFLGQAGQRVLVLEKESLPRYKTCGGGLSADVLRQFPFSFEPVIERRVKAVRYVLGEQAVTIPVPGDAMVMVMRDRFDAFLLEHARAEVRSGVRVTGVRDEAGQVIVETAAGEKLAGRYLVAADGANSSVAHSLRLRMKKTLAAAIEVEAQVPAKILDEYGSMPMLVFGKVAHGYVWIFPKADHLSIGVGSLRPGPGQLQAALKESMAPFGISLDGGTVHGHPVPIFRRREALATRRAFLVGDAAGLVDPFTGEGIRFAITSGRLAAEAILAERPQEYARQVDRRIRFSHALGSVLADSFFAFPKIWWTLAVKNPYATGAFVEMLSGRSSYPKVALRLAASLPLYLLRPHRK